MSGSSGYIYVIHDPEPLHAGPGKPQVLDSGPLEEKDLQPATSTSSAWSWIVLSSGFSYFFFLVFFFM
jgi:hypothetical protein